MQCRSKTSTASSAAQVFEAHNRRTNKLFNDKRVVKNNFKLLEIEKKDILAKVDELKL